MTDTTTKIQVTTLEAHDLRALRHADRIIFRLHEGQATVECIREERNSPTGFEQKHVILADTHVTDYARDHTWVDESHYSAFFMAYPGPDITTMFARVRTGEKLTLHWTKDNNTDIAREHGLHIDSLTLRVTKRTGKTEHYNVRTETCYDNSARMVRRAR